MNWYILLGGFGLGIIAMWGVIWIIGRKPDPPPGLPKKLVEFWEESILQKNVELEILKGIREALKQKGGMPMGK